GGIWTGCTRRIPGSPCCRGLRSSWRPVRRASSPPRTDDFCAAVSSCPRCHPAPALLEEPSRAESAVKRRQSRALVIAALEDATDAGHTAQEAGELVQAVRD